MSKEKEIEEVTEIKDPGMAYIRIIETTDFYKKGEVCDILPDLAHKLIEKGIAQGITFEDYRKDQLKKWDQILDKAVKKDKSEKRRKFTLAGLRVDNFLVNVEEFYERQPFFYDKSGIFWFWDVELSKYSMKDDIDVMIALEDVLDFNGQTINGSIKNQYLEALKRVGRCNKPKEAPKKWIQFKNKAYSLSSRKIYEVTPDYFFTNPIPWEMGESEDTPTMDKLFIEWVGEEYKQTLYELIAYSCYTEYPIQLLFCLYGNGRNGKSQYQKISSKFIGKENICSTELETLINSRFEVFKLYKKLVCSMGETNFGLLTHSSMIKKLTGGDSIGFEMKNKNPFDDYNYAKIIISSNSLPYTDDTSDGFYRRWNIIPFVNEFEESGHEIFTTIPEIEYNNLAKKICTILSNLLKVGKFTKQGTIEERKNKFIMASNPVSIFLSNCCNREYDLYVSYNELYTNYLKFLQINKNRKVRRKEFKSALEDEGFSAEKTSKPDGVDSFGNNKHKILYWIQGIGMKENWKEVCPFAFFQLNLTQISHVGKEVEKAGKKAKGQNPETIHQKCHICGSKPSNHWGKQGKPECSDCYDHKKI